MQVSMDITLLTYLRCEKFNLNVFIIYSGIGAIIQKGLWTQDHPSQDINVSLIRKPTVHGEVMHEKESDDCLTELFGTR